MSRRRCRTIDAGRIPADLPIPIKDVVAMFGAARNSAMSLSETIVPLAFRNRSPRARGHGPLPAAGDVSRSSCPPVTPAIRVDDADDPGPATLITTGAWISSPEASRTPLDPPRHPVRIPDHFGAELRTSRALPLCRGCIEVLGRQGRIGDVSRHWARRPRTLKSGRHWACRKARDRPCAWPARSCPAE